MATLSLTWKDFNLNEDGFNIYRSETPMDVNNMPAPIATVGPNVGSYDDTTGVVGTVYYYRVGAVRGTEEKISPEIFRVFDDTVNIHDVFGDGSAVATYQFNGDVTDLGGTYNGTVTGESYTTGLIDRAISLPTGSMDTGYSLSGNYSISFWLEYASRPSTYEAVLSQYLSSTSSQRFIIRMNAKTIDPNASENLEIFQGGSYSSPLNFDYGVFNHIVLICNGDTIRLINRTLNQEVSLSSIGMNSATLLVSGFDNIAFTKTALFDQFRIFNRALTQEEVNLLYQEGAQFL